MRAAGRLAITCVSSPIVELDHLVAIRARAFALGETFVPCVPAFSGDDLQAAAVAAIAREPIMIMRFAFFVEIAKGIGPITDRNLFKHVQLAIADPAHVRWRDITVEQFRVILTHAVAADPDQQQAPLLALYPVGGFVGRQNALALLATIRVLGA